MRAAMRVAAGVAGLWLVAAKPALAQVQMIIPWPAGGGTDIIGRLIQPVLSETLNAQVVIRNVGGATGTIGSAEIVRSKGDGQNMLLTSLAAVVIQPAFLARPPYQANQLAPVCMVAQAPATLMTPNETGLRTVADIVARARANPGQMPFASGGVGSLGHLAMTGFQRAFGIQMNHIPFRGSGDSVQAMLSGTVPVLTAEANLVQQYGLHAIAVFGTARSPDQPQAPTMRELGHDLVFPLWTGLFVSTETPESLLARLDAACRRTLETASVRDGMTRAGHPIHYLSHRDAATYVREEAVKYARLIQESGLRQAD
jgi:tripartite-type tricarboxylate transporter receptor subunit TctC